MFRDSPFGLLDAIPALLIVAAVSLAGAVQFGWLATGTGADSLASGAQQLPLAEQVEAGSGERVTAAASPGSAPEAEPLNREAAVEPSGPPPDTSASAAQVGETRDVLQQGSEAAAEAEGAPAAPRSAEQGGETALAESSPALSRPETVETEPDPSGLRVERASTTTSAATGSAPAGPRDGQAEPLGDADPPHATTGSSGGSPNPASRNSDDAEGIRTGDALARAGPPSTAASQDADPVKPPNAPSEAHYVQLAAGSREADAYRAAESLTEDLAEILRGREVRVIPAQKEGNTIYRLWAGPFVNAAESNLVCGEVFLFGEECLVVETGADAVPAFQEGELSTAARTGFVSTTIPASASAAPRSPGSSGSHVTLTSLNYRVGPDEGEARLGTLPEGATVEVLSERDAWAKILLADGREAYVALRFLDPVE